MIPPSGNAVAKVFAAAAPKLDALADSICDKQVLSDFCNIIIHARSKQKLNDEQLAALEKSTKHLIGQKLTKKLIHSNAYRVIANWHFIAEGMEIPVWEGDPIDCACTFLGLNRKRIKNNNKLYLEVRLKLRTGLAAGIICGSRFTQRQINFFLKRQSGAGSYNCAVEEISGMKAQLTVELQGEDIRVTDWKCNQSDKDYNRTLAEMRRNARKCSRPIPCNTCSKTVNECKLAIWLAQENNDGRN